MQQPREVSASAFFTPSVMNKGVSMSRMCGTSTGSAWPRSLVHTGWTSSTLGWFLTAAYFILLPSRLGTGLRGLN